MSSPSYASAAAAAAGSSELALPSDIAAENARRIEELKQEAENNKLDSVVHMIYSARMHLAKTTVVQAEITFTRNKEDTYHKHSIKIIRAWTFPLISPKTVAGEQVEQLTNDLVFDRFFRAMGRYPPYPQLRKCWLIEDSYHDIGRQLNALVYGALRVAREPPIMVRRNALTGEFRSPRTADQVAKISEFWKSAPGPVPEREVECIGHIIAHLGGISRDSETGKVPDVEFEVVFEPNSLSKDQFVLRMAPQST